MTDPEVPDRPDVTADDERVQQRQELTAEEQAAGSDDPVAQAQAILAESEERTLDPAGAAEAADVSIERRQSEDTI
jgi:hypothetical protein